MPFLGLLEHRASWDAQTYMQAKHAHKISKFKKIKLQTKTKKEIEVLLSGRVLT